MSASKSECPTPEGPSADDAGDAGRKRVLILEPETLVSWSLVAYLAEWFIVVAADSERTAAQHLDDDPFDALVISDDVDESAAGRLVDKAYDRNPSVRIVRTVTRPSRPPAPGTEALWVEKPFDLARVAKLLGVGGSHDQ